MRLAIDAGRLGPLLQEWDREAAAFRESRKPFLLYPSSGELVRRPEEYELIAAGAAIGWLVDRAVTRRPGHAQLLKTGATAAGNPSRE